MKYVSEIYAQPALVTSETLAWQGVRVERHQLGAMELPPHYHEHHLLLLHQMPDPIRVHRKKGSHVQQGLLRQGDLGLYPSGEYDRVAWDGFADTIHVHVDNRYLETLAHQNLDRVRFNLEDRFQFNDALLYQLGQQLLVAVGTQHTLGLLYIESLTNALCYHLIENYATHERRPAPDRRLPDSVLNRIDAYLEVHADELVTLKALADLAHLSVFHFTRLFRQTTGVTPYQYVIRWKIRRALQMLKADEASIAVISDALGFASPGHFSAAFKRAVGMSPRAFQQSSLTA